MGKGVAQLNRYSLEIQRDIANYILDTDGKDIRVQYKLIDQAKLLKLRTWAIRYFIPIPEILRLIVPPLRDQMGLRFRGYTQQRRYGLGLSIGSLTGQGAERILLEELIKKYPDGDNVIQWAEHERMSYLEREKEEDLDGLTPSKLKQHEMSIIYAESIDSFVNKYKARILRERDSYQKELNAAWRKRKQFRWNPFC